MKNKFIKVLLFIAGSLSLLFGVIGIFLPLLPTTPFLILSATCYSLSSKRALNFLLTNKIFGKYLKNYLSGRGIPTRVKVTAISLLWITILISVVFVLDSFFLKLLLLLIAVLVTYHIVKISPRGKKYHQKRENIHFLVRNAQEFE